MPILSVEAISARRIGGVGVELSGPMWSIFFYDGKALAVCDNINKRVFVQAHPISMQASRALYNWRLKMLNKYVQVTEPTFATVMAEALSLFANTVTEENSNADSAPFFHD